ncbi:MAG TPA: DUF6600 domain-containing protein [Planctomycetota bacterium]|jgi:hypothetical protein
MRYVAISAVALAMAFSLPDSRAWGAVSVEAGVNVGGGELNIGYFHDQLAPHGRWVETARYGQAWQPALVVTDVNWQPYFDGGHWVYTDAGWYWDSTYDWGWAPFHYGRWAQDAEYRWLWIPDVTWAPAWVIWRQSDAVFGWAPLPFGARFEGGVFVGAGLDLGLEAFVFVPAHSFLSGNLRTVAVDRQRAARVFNETKVVNNSYAFKDNRVINNGIPLQQVASATKQQIKPVQIADAKAPAKGGAEGGKIQAFRPAIKNETPKAGAAADKKGTEAKGGTTQTKPGTSTTVPAQHVTKEPAANTQKKPGEAQTPEPKATQPQQPTGEQQRSQRASEQQQLNQQHPTGQQRATEEQRLNAERRLEREAETHRPQAQPPAKPEARPTEPKATEPSHGRPEAKKEEGKSGREY